MHKVMWTHVHKQNKKSECGIAQLILPFLSYFHAAAHVHLVELINLNDLLADRTFLLSTNQSFGFCLGWSVSRSADRGSKTTKRVWKVDYKQLKLNKIFDLSRKVYEEVEKGKKGE